MKKLLLLAALFALFMNATLWGQSITVTSPTRGEPWCLGSTYRITWTKSGAMPATVAVRLRRGGSPESEAPVLTITGSTANNGSLSWAIPVSVPAGRYFIRVRTSSPDVIGDSALFDISGPLPASIHVTAVSFGNEWCVGSTHAITWIKSPCAVMPATVAVRLRRAGAPESEPPVSVITPSTANNGSISWTIPDSVPAGDYFIRISSTSPVVSDDSPNFVIKPCFTKPEVQQWPQGRQIPSTILRSMRIGQVSGSISGAAPSASIRGHKVRVVLKKGGVLAAAGDYVLDAQGSCNYQFQSLLLGAYEVTVEPVATSLAMLPPGTENVCFQNTTPALQTVVLDAVSSSAAGKNFLINYVSAWDMPASCW